MPVIPPDYNVWAMLVDMVANALAPFANLLPMAPTLNLTQSFGPFFNLLGTVNQAVPVEELGQALAIYVAVQVGVLTFVVARSFWRFVPVLGGGGG